MKPITQLLQDFVDNYEAIQETNGAGHFMDESRTFTCGQWAAGRFDNIYRAAKEALAGVDTINGSMVIKRTDDTIFMRIPASLRTPITTGCACDYCKEEKAKNPGYVPTWDTFAVGKEQPKKGNDYGYTCHMPFGL